MRADGLLAPLDTATLPDVFDAVVWRPNAKLEFQHTSEYMPLACGVNRYLQDIEAEKHRSTLFEGEQQARFDQNAQAWLKQREAEGYRLEIPGVKT